MNITINHTTTNFSNQRTSKKYIVWHDTGVRDQSDEGNAVYFKTVYREASAHYFIDENSITEVVDPNYVAWHCGDGNGLYGITNQNSIGIELCVEANGLFKPETIANAVWLGKKLMKDFGISADNNVRHYDASRKNCPQFLNTDGKWTKWYAFKAQLGGVATITTPVVTVPEGVTFSGQAHVQEKGWTGMSNNTLGTVGKGLRLEAFSLVVKNNGKVQPLTGSIHVQDIGNVAYNQNTNLFGTVGQEKRLEAILINVGNGVQYRTHVANQGWGAWVSSGQWSGTKEMGLRIEAIEFRVG